MSNLFLGFDISAFAAGSAVFVLGEVEAVAALWA